MNKNAITNLAEPSSSATGPADMESLVAEVTDDFIQRLSRGELPEIEEYARRYPQIADVLQHVLPALRVMRSPLSEMFGVTEGEQATVSGCLGDFRLLREIGRGGMGIVYEAEQISLGRRVALKVLPFASTLDPKQMQRFKNEAQAAAGLHHTNIVPVHATGCERGVHYYVMQFIEGQTLAAMIHELRRLQGRRPEGTAAAGTAEEPLAAASAEPAQLPPTGPYLPPIVAPYHQGLGVITCPAAETTPQSAALATPASITGPAFFRTVTQLGIQAAEALEYAHQLGVIHRDIKPANLLLEGAPVESGLGIRLWITDFGLAHCQGGAELTMSGDLLGTLRYMSPEQTLAKRVIVDERTDIYSLGVTLYELLTLEPAFPGTNRQEVFRQIAFEDPKPPRRLNKAIPPELETIVLKAMEKNSADRYATAHEIAEDLQHFLDDKPIRARRPTLVQRLRKWTRRHRGVTVTTILFTLGLLVLAVAALAVTNVLVRHESGQKSQALHDKEEALQKESAARAIARRNLYVAHMNLAQVHWENANVSRVEELLDLYRRVEPGQEDLRGWEWYYQERLCHAGVRTLRGHEGWVLSVAFSPDGTRLATGSNDQMVKVWEVATGRELRTFQGNKTQVGSMVFSPDGTRMATVSEDNTVKVWDVPSGKELRTFRGKNSTGASCLAFNSDGTRLARGDGMATVWDVASGDELCRLDLGFSVALSPDGTRMATAKTVISGGFVDNDFDIIVWDVKSRQRLRNLRGHNERVSTVTFSPDGARLASGSFDKTVKVWDIASGKELRTFQGHTNWVTTVAFSPKGARLASGSFDHTVKVWEESSGKELRTFRGHNNWVTTVAFSPNGTLLASGGSDQTVKVWDVGINQEFRTLHEKLPVATSVTFSRDGTLLASGSYKSAMISDVASGKLLRTLPGGVNCVAFSPDGTRVATGGSHDKSIRVWEVASGKELHTLQAPKHEVNNEEQINTLCFSSEGKYLASGSHHGAVKLWDVAGGKELRTLQGAKNLGTENMVWSVAFSPDGTSLASNHGRTVKVWEIASGKELLTLQGHKDQVVCVAFSPNRALLASCSNDRTVKLWDLASGQELRTLRGHWGEVHRVAFSPDGARLASCSNDHTVKLWDVVSGQELRTLRHEDLVQDVAFGPDGRRLASTAGGTVRLWEATPWTDAPR